MSPHSHSFNASAWSTSLLQSRHILSFSDLKGTGILYCLNFLFSWEAKKKKMKMLAKSEYLCLNNSFSFSMRSSKQMKILVLLAFGHPNQGSQLALLLIHKSFCEFYLLPRSTILFERKKWLFRWGSLTFSSNVMDFIGVMDWGRFIHDLVLCIHE